MTEAEKKALILEHRQLVAKFKGEEEIATRLKQIEHKLDMTAKEMAESAIGDYARQY